MGKLGVFYNTHRVSVLQDDKTSVDGDGDDGGTAERCT